MGYAIAALVTVAYAAVAVVRYRAIMREAADIFGPRAAEFTTVTQYARRRAACWAVPYKIYFRRDIKWQREAAQLPDPQEATPV